MLQLNLPTYQFRIKKEEEKYFIFDSQRKRYVSLTPEEWVRQHFIRFMIEERSYPAALLAVEEQLELNGLKKRCDAILYDNRALPRMIIEFKAPHIRITQQVFDQVAVYNSRLQVDFFIISNGLEHYCCRVNTIANCYDFMEGIPDYHQLG